MAPPRLFAELFVKLVLATVVARDSLTMPPPLPVPSDWLFEKVEVLIVADPVPPPPGAANPNVSRSAPPPPMPPEVLRLNVEPVTVRIPVAAVCIGADGVNVMPPPLP